MKPGWRWVTVVLAWTVLFVGCVLGDCEVGLVGLSVFANFLLNLLYER